MSMKRKYAGTFEILDNEDIELHFTRCTKSKALADRQREIEHIRDLALAIADIAAPEVLISSSTPVTVDGETWYDLHSIEDKEDFEGEIEYADARDLFYHHPAQPNLVQVKEWS
jgi:hypothetical protein